MNKGRTNNPNGRPKGTRNKATESAAEVFKYFEFDPLSKMIAEYNGAVDDERLVMMRLADVDLDPESIKALQDRLVSHRRDRVAMLKELMKYRHPALQSIEHKGEDGGPIKITVNYGQGGD